MDYEKASRFWTDRAAQSQAAPDAKEKLTAFIAARQVCALATGAGDWVRCTPIEYTWLDGAFYLFSEGGLKFKGLADNPNISLAIFDSGSQVSFGQLHSVQISGRAQIIEPFSMEYNRLLAHKHIPEKTIRAMADPMHLIKVSPLEADYLDTDFKEAGYDARQHVTF